MVATGANSLPISSIQTTKKTSRKSSFTVTAGTRQAKQQIAECQLLDTLLRGFALPNDAALAAWLGVDKSLIYAIRAGKRRLGLMQRLKVLDHIGFLKARSLVESILPHNLAADLVALNQRMVRDRAANALVQSDPLETSVLLVEAAKTALGCQTDAALADFLGVADNTLSMIRTRRSAGLGPKPRLRLLQFLAGGFDADQLIALANSSLRLAREIETCLRRHAETIRTSPT